MRKALIRQVSVFAMRADLTVTGGLPIPVPNGRYTRCMCLCLRCCVIIPVAGCGHRDLSPDLNGNGEIEPEEWVKACPCFDAEEEGLTRNLLNEYGSGTVFIGKF